MIFSFLNRQDQRTIYWLNKKLRNLLPDSALKMNIDNFKKFSSYQLESQLMGILELSDGTIACWTMKDIKLLYINHNNNLEIIKSLPIHMKSYCESYPIQFENGDIMFISDDKEITQCEKGFNLIETYEEFENISSLCKISELSFAIGMINGKVKIYTRNENTKKFEMYKDYQCHSKGVYCLLYLPKQNYLLSGSGTGDKTINVLSLSEGKSIQTLTGHTKWATSLISLNDKTFASGSRNGVIKIWSIKEDSTIECISTIKSPENRYNSILLQNLSKEFMVSMSGIELKIWDVKTYECINTFIEDSLIRFNVCTKNLDILSITDDKKVNLWKTIV
jgi:WD40 repeat protein